MDWYWRDYNRGWPQDLVLYSGDKTKHIQGVDFTVEKQTAKCVMECISISGRIITIKIATKLQNLTVKVYAPTSDCDEAKREEFYEELESVRRTRSRKDITII